MGFCPCTFRGKVNCLVSGRGWSTKERKTLTFSLFTNWWSADWVEWSAVLNRKWDLYDDKISWEWFTQPHMQSTLISLPISEKSPHVKPCHLKLGGKLCVCLFFYFFQILHVFAPLNDVRAYSAWSRKNNPNYVNFWTSLIPPLTFEWPPQAKNTFIFILL